MSGIALQMKGIDKSFSGNLVLKDVSLEVRKGEIHALVGENGAGKSTLMKILGGIYDADAGEIFLNGEKTEINTPIEAIQKGISIIHQEFNLIPTLSVADNIYLGKEKVCNVSNGERLNKSAMRDGALAIMEKLNMRDIDVRKQVKELSVAQQQLVEIGKALQSEAQILVMDEPTAPLTGKETDKLFEIMTDLKKQGIAVIFISHRLEEVQSIADRITIMRDGQKIVTLNNENRDVEKDEIVKHMVGRELVDYYPVAQSKPSDEIVLEVRHLSKKGMFEDISFSLKKGEILGFSGMIGAGRTEIALAIFGAHGIDGGEIQLEHKAYRPSNIQDAISAGIALVPEDRKRDGLILIMDIADNIGLSNTTLISDNGVISGKKKINLANMQIKNLQIKPDNPFRTVLNLSGGNQQKVVLGKWIATQPKVLILDEPTRGVDVGAKREIYDIMRKLTAQGVSIIFISSEMPELLGMCDRMLVMHEGRICGEFLQNEMDQQEIMRCATGEIRK